MIHAFVIAHIFHNVNVIRFFYDTNLFLVSGAIRTNSTRISFGYSVTNRTEDNFIFYIMNCICKFGGLIDFTAHQKERQTLSSLLSNPWKPFQFFYKFCYRCWSFHRVPLGYIAISFLIGIYPIGIDKLFFPFLSCSGHTYC